MENKILIHGEYINYVIEYKRIKNIYFRVKEDKIICVTSSKMASEKYIYNLLVKNEDAIYKMLTKVNNRVCDNNLYYLGNKLILVISDKTYIDNDYIYAKSYEDAKAYIYSLANDVFSSRLNQIKCAFSNLPSFRLRTRKMTTKWGVCNKKSMTVTLNTDLIFKEVHLIDYVIVHELCHFKYMNHSKEYWEYVKSFYPYYKEARKELNY